MFETAGGPLPLPGRAGDGLSRDLLDATASRELDIRRMQAEQIDAVARYAGHQRDLHGDDELDRLRGGDGAPGPEQAELCERGIAFEVAAAFGVSITSARMLVNDAEALTAHHQATLDAVRAGRIGLWVARQIAAATRFLAPDVVGGMDAELAEEACHLLPGQVRAMVDARVAAADPEAAARRAAQARADKDVFVVHKPDAVALLGANLPAEQAIACYEALDNYARGRRCDGDERSIAHLMADTLVERVTGAARADAAATVELQVVMTDTQLLGSCNAPAELVGHGAVPVDLARQLGAGSTAWVRRLLTDPIDSTVTTVDTKRRRFDGALRDLIRIRDRRCRNPVCNAKIRDIDHRVEHSLGGPTSSLNADGYCQRCHHLKDHSAIAISPAAPQAHNHGHAIQWTGPSGKSYPSLAPPAVGHGHLDLAALKQRTAILKAAQRRQ